MRQLVSALALGGLAAAIVNRLPAGRNLLPEALAAGVTCDGAATANDIPFYTSGTNIGEDDSFYYLTGSGYRYIRFDQGGGSSGIGAGAISNTAGAFLYGYEPGIDCVINLGTDETHACDILLFGKNIAGYEAGNILYGGSSYSSFAGASSLNVINRRNGPVAFFTNGAEAMRITGGGNVGIGTKSPLAPLHVHAATNENYLARDVNVALGLAPGTFLGVGFQGANDAFSANVALGFIGSPIMIAGGNVYMGQTAPSTAPTQQLQMQQGAFCTGTVWVNASDRNLKENFTALDENEILTRLESVPIQKWNYKDEPKATHIGPVAQDFYAAYQLGVDDKSIGTVDADGIALAAIKALHKQFKDENKKLQERIAILEQTVKQFGAN